MQLITLSLLASSLFGLGQAFVIQGFDIDGSEGYPDWEAAYKDGARFATIRATSGNLKKDELFKSHWEDAKEEGFIRAAYHQGKPSLSSGKEQAEFFLNHGGRWTADNSTIPGVMEVTAPEFGDQCYGLNSNETIQFITEWTDTYFKATERMPFLRINLSWYDNCTDYWYSFPQNAYMALIDMSDHPPADHDLLITYGSTWTMWSNEEDYEPGGYSDVFGGDIDRLRSFTRKDS